MSSLLPEVRVLGPSGLRTESKRVWGKATLPRLQGKPPARGVFNRPTAGKGITHVERARFTLPGGKQVLNLTPLTA